MDNLFNKKITRREFLKFCGKAVLIAGLAYALPKIFGSPWDLLSSNKIKIKVKPFSRADLYQKHNLIG